jgi:hypothetical protein
MGITLDNCAYTKRREMLQHCLIENVLTFAPLATHVTNKFALFA